MSVLVRKPSGASTSRPAGPGKPAPASRPPSRQAIHQGRTAPGPSSQRPRADGAPSTAQERNIQVIVRCRALSWQEIEEKSDECVTVEPGQGTDVAIAGAQPPKTGLPPASLSGFTHESPLKSYTFDRVFGPSADQGLLFNQVVVPILDEVLQGYNCTCLCYGQTGTGKTYTMEGDLNPALGTYSPQAGIIPRALHRLFELLNRDHHDYAVKVAYIELYNEELRDLNAPGEMTVPLGAHQPMSRVGPTGRGSAAAPLRDAEPRIFDDAKRGVSIQGIEETNITSVAEGIRILTRGSQRRQAASTQVNEHSSRSHSIFTITVHSRETSEVGTGSETGGTEDRLKIGKLHLVDLAGSENVGRSGAQASRAREAGMINQSLLTLGRVITSLAERVPHVPYRESKLTRILQDSLGGRTKTCIIATISPAQVNYDETLSTLEYALRAKAIQNRPEANARMTKAALLSQYSIEIERLKGDLHATRTKNGIHVTQDSWDSMHGKHEETRKDAEMQKRHAAAYQMALAARTEEFEQCCKLLGVRESELKSLMEDLDRTSNDLAYRDAELQVAQKAITDEAILRQAHDDKRREYKAWAKWAIDDTAGLMEKIARKHAVEQSNLAKAADAEAVLSIATVALREQLAALFMQQRSFTETIRKGLDRGLYETTHLAEEVAKSVTGGKQSVEEAQEAAQCDLVALAEASAVLLSSTDEKRSEFLDDVRERAEDLRNTCTDAVDALLNQQQILMDQSFAAMQRILQEIETGHAAMVGRLQTNISTLQQCKEAEEARLQAEIERLEAQNATLERLHVDQKNSAKDFKQSLLGTMAAQIDCLLDSQNALRSTAFDNLRSSAEETRKDVQKATQDRLALQDRLLLNESAALDCANEAERAIEQAAKKIREDLDDAVEQGKKEGEQIGALLSEAVDANERAYALYEDMAAVDSTTYRETIVAKQSAIQTSLGKLAGISASTLDEISDAVTKVCDPVQATARSTIEVLGGHAGAHESALDVLAAHIDSLRAPQLEVDLITGRTPRPRDWPLLLDEDELEGGREQLLARLRETAGTPVPLPAPAPEDVTLPPLVKLDIPLGAATAKTVEKRSVLGNKLPNQAQTGRRPLHDSSNRA